MLSKMSAYLLFNEHSANGVKGGEVGDDNSPAVTAYICILQTVHLLSDNEQAVIWK